MPALYQNNKDVPEDMLLGNLLFFNLNDMTVDENDLIALFKANNISEDFIRPISHADAFRRASSSIKNATVTYTDDNGDTFEGKINVDEVVNDKMYIKRIVGVRVLNDEQEEVFYKQIGTVSFDRANDSCSSILDPNITNVHNNSDINVYLGLLSEIEMKYTKWSKYHNHDTIKNVINRIVTSMHPIALMPTGICKFIPKTSKDTLYGLQGLLHDLSQYTDNNNENTVEIIPILDTQEHRDLVNKMYETEIKEVLYNYSQEIAEILKNKQSISSRQASTYLERYKEIKDKVQDYENLLGTYTESIQSQLKAAFQLIDDNKEE